MSEGVFVNAVLRGLGYRVARVLWGFVLFAFFAAAGTGVLAGIGYWLHVHAAHVQALR
jgi:hypothetical protein